MPNWEKCPGVWKRLSSVWMVTCEKRNFCFSLQGQPTVCRCKVPGEGFLWYCVSSGKSRNCHNIFMRYLNVTFRYWQNKAHSHTAVLVNNYTSHVNALWLDGGLLKILSTYKFVHLTKMKSFFTLPILIILVCLPACCKWVISMTCLIFKVYSSANQKLKITAAGKIGIIWSHKIQYLSDMLERILIHRLRKGIRLIPLLFWTLHLTHFNYISLLIYEFSCLG